MFNNADMQEARDDAQATAVNAARRARVSTALGARTDTGGADAILVSNLVNVRYLTGFTGSNGAVIVWADADDRHADRISTDGRYVSQVAAQSPDLAAEIARDCPKALLEYALTRRPGLRVAIEGDAMSVSEFADLKRVAEAGGAELVPVRAVVERLREVKDPAEVEFITSACRIGDDALAALIGRGAIAAGRTERQVARDLEWEMFALGADAIAFETIVAAGANSAIPHHRPTDDVLQAGDLVKIDFGAVSRGYHSDMTRTFVLGEPQDWQREIYEIVASAQRAGRDASAPGADLASIDAAARDVIVAAGYGDYYVHGLGHGVGLEIHEGPGIGAAASGTLPVGATVTVEPGIYLPGRGGVRIEDTLVVADAGPRLLTTTPRTLRVL
ncbi:M24 family metallopeptidase [Gordonia neofelifaecis]|uniref:X-Pro dipeptidase n=1 Tax=Gordonia neofelifaecis NRRL B-59395 TaxID=644548 RepID=F1YG91_9ACTN|nr:aminopeptidase P family protein [Gordonia neofelifaecis]EGD56064.1 X-Pro dipeptidase [Gordonia neofelifaecis NRRL B-59395]